MMFNLIRRIFSNGKKLTCPSCGEKTGQKIRYGHPGFSYRPNRHVYGGCIIRYGKSPEFGCLYCGHVWGVLKRSDDSAPMRKSPLEKERASNE